jgi:hypothetical protein
VQQQQATAATFFCRQPFITLQARFAWVCVLDSMRLLSAQGLHVHFCYCAGGKELLPTAIRPQLPICASGKAWTMPNSIEADIESGMGHSLRQDGMQQVAAAGVWQLVYVAKALLPTATRSNLPTAYAKTEAADGLFLDVLTSSPDQVSKTSICL